MELTIEGFIDFVNDQEDNEEIDHWTWSTCAVGEYVDFVVENSNIDLLASEVYEVREVFLGELEEFQEPLFNLLNENGVDENNDLVVETYGDLKMWIKEYGKD